MKEQLISFETAKLAKEKGFKVGSDMKWSDNVEGQKPVLCSFQEGVNGIYSALFINSEESYHTYEAPTQSLLQKWLREKHNIEIECYRTMETVEGYNYGCQGENWNDDLTEDMFNFYGKTYEETLEKGLQEALNLIK